MKTIIILTGLSCVDAGRDFTKKWYKVKDGNDVCYISGETRTPFKPWLSRPKELEMCEHNGQANESCHFVELQPDCLTQCSHYNDNNDKEESYVFADSKGQRVIISKDDLTRCFQREDKTLLDKNADDQGCCPFSTRMSRMKEALPRLKHAWSGIEEAIRWNKKGAKEDTDPKQSHDDILPVVSSSETVSNPDWYEITLNVSLMTGGVQENLRGDRTFVVGTSGSPRSLPYFVQPGAGGKCPPGLFFREPSSNQIIDKRGRLVRTAARGKGLCMKFDKNPRQYLSDIILEAPAKGSVQQVDVCQSPSSREDHRCDWVAVRSDCLTACMHSSNTFDAYVIASAAGQHNIILKDDLLQKVRPATDKKRTGDENTNHKNKKARREDVDL